MEANTFLAERNCNLIAFLQSLTHLNHASQPASKKNIKMLSNHLATWGCLYITDVYRETSTGKVVSYFYPGSNFTFTLLLKDLENRYLMYSVTKAALASHMTFIYFCFTFLITIGHNKSMSSPYFG